MPYNSYRALNFILATLIIAFLFSATGCAGGTEVGNPVSVPGGAEGIGEPTEFELMALCVSGQSTPPAEFADLFKNDITNIRSQSYEGTAVSGLIPDTSISFTPPWVPGKIIIGFDDFTANLVATGNYHMWDDLNSKFDLKEINLSSIDYGQAFLEFNNKSIHPRYIAEQYQALLGIDYAEVVSIVGDCSNIYLYIPGYDEGGMSIGALTDMTRYYLYRKGGGDCPSGCTINDYWLFSVDANGIKYMGYYNPDESPDEPDWWGIAQKSLNLYRTY